eukprot:m.277745 g.277745  ORF g.277745 m.277745 type:complete len:710 (+) comp17712_c0_seq2:109-2238(+)
MPKQDHSCRLLWLASLISVVVFIVLKSESYSEPPLKVLTSSNGLNNQLNFSEHYDLLVVGAGPAGAVFADLAARILHQRVLVLDERNHIGGRYFDGNLSNQLSVGKYGLELFHSNNARTWQYWHRHGNITARGDFRATAYWNDTFVPFPANKDSIHSLNSNHTRGLPPAVRPEALMLRSYVMKRWGVPTEELDATVLQNLQARASWDDRHYPNDQYQGVPSNGYNKWFQAAFDHPNITVRTSTSYFELPSVTASHVIYTHSMDTYFQHKESIHLERLHYRTVKVSASVNPYKPVIAQPAAIVYYPDENDGPYTVCVDQSRLLSLEVSVNLGLTWVFVELQTQSTNRTSPRVYCQAYSETDDVMAGLVPSKKNKQLWEHYARLAAQESKSHNVHFVGLFHEDVAGVVSHALDSFDRIFGPIKVAIPHMQQASASTILSVNLIVSVFREDLSWLSETCHGLRSTFDFQLHVIIYSKHPKNTLATVTQLIRGCNATAEVIQLPNVGREGHTWLVYMLTRELDFADVNVFFQGHRETKDDVITYAVRQLQELLLNETQASSKAIREAEIQDYEGTCPLPLHSDLGNVSWPSSRLHYLAFGPQIRGWPYSPLNESYHELMHEEYCEWVRAGIDPDCTLALCSESYKSFRGEHIVTDAGLRRAIARHRTLLARIYSSLRSSSTPLSGHVLERLWLTLFKGVVASDACPFRQMRLS